jgi:hypothetical protein
MHTHTYAHTHTPHTRNRLPEHLVMDVLLAVISRLELTPRKCSLFLASRHEQVLTRTREYTCKHMHARMNMPARTHTHTHTHTHTRTHTHTHTHEGFGVFPQKCGCQCGFDARQHPQLPTTLVTPPRHFSSNAADYSGCLAAAGLSDGFARIGDHAIAAAAGSITG